MTELQDGRAIRQQSIYSENKMKLIETAIEVINEIGDINEVTLSTIAKAAGVSPATAYNHFPERMTDLLFCYCFITTGRSRHSHEYEYRTRTFRHYFANSLHVWKGNRFSWIYWSSACRTNGTFTS